MILAGLLALPFPPIPFSAILDVESVPYSTPLTLPGQTARDIEGRVAGGPSHHPRFGHGTLKLRFTQDAEAILDQAAQRHRQLKSLQASFTQRIRNPILEINETSSGTFYFKAPLQYRIAFSRPPEDVVVSTGRDVWIYLPSSQPGQVIKSEVSEDSKGFAPYQFIYDFKDRYEAELVGEERIGGRPAYHLLLSPASPDAEYNRAELWVDKQSLLTRQMEVEEPNGVARRFLLESHRPNARLGAALFRFVPPRGVEVFEQ
jgi:outer membrane lipoprotein carrier protein